MTGLPVHFKYAGTLRNHKSIHLADLVPWPAGTSQAAEARWDLLADAASHIGLIDQNAVTADAWAAAILTDDRLPELREAVVTVGERGQNRQIASAGPFTDYAGYQWRFHVTHKAATRKQVLVILDRLKPEGKTPPCE